MDVVTENRHITCKNCNKNVDVFYSDQICVDCLVKKRGRFPEGIGCYKPCNKCKEPKIKWYKVNSYGKRVSCCNLHN